MAKKLIIVWLSITMVTFSSISIYAEDNTQEDFFIPRTPLSDEELLSDVSVLYAYEEKESRTIATSIWFADQAVIDQTAEEEAADAAAKEAEKLQKQKEEEHYVKGLAAYIRTVNGNISKKTAQNYARYFIKYGDKYDLDEKLLMALAQTESTFNHDSVSSEDCKGMMQTSDGVGRNAGYEPHELFTPRISIKVGARYLEYKLDEHGSMKLALTAYNQGSGSVNSGNYSLGFAKVVLEREDIIQDFLEDNGYIG